MWTTTPCSPHSPTPGPRRTPAARARRSPPPTGRYQARSASGRVRHTRTNPFASWVLCRPRSTKSTSAAAGGWAAGMQSLQDKASEWSGVAAADAFAIDDVNIFESLGGTPQPFVDLSTNFYTRVYGDEEGWFREIFAGSKKEDAIQNQYEFLIQRMGGPPLFSQRRGHPALIGRHRPFLVTHQAAERWLHHMRQALDTTASIDEDSKTKMMNFFRHTAYFLVAGNEMTRQGQGVACKHATSKPAE
ncbi:hypothetical protein U9M48_027158 [Paspalum notatum var. saurae]|uniref:Hemoglobin n=1 Tax=Paspalum notatum var. saurae TaxID=547442 RepID=A0AAQ3TUD9_PASNO